MMMKEPTFGAGLWMFSQFVDRYATDAYGPMISTSEAIDRAGQVGQLSALDINYPFSEGTALRDVQEALARNQLLALAITPHLYTRIFQRGSFTNPDAALRRQAIELSKEAVDVAHQLGAKYVKFWPGQDGFDYPFQVDYRRVWEDEVRGTEEVAAFDPSMQFAIEYKFKEPRVHMLLNTAARTLLAIEEMRVDNVGIVLDLGHSLLGHEAPAEALELVARRGKLVSVEMNDNWREWDDDLTVGSVHLMETLEFLDELRRLSFEGVWMLDQFPFREDPVQAARTSIKTLRAMNRILDRLDGQALRRARLAQDAMAAQRFVLDVLLSQAGEN